MGGRRRAPASRRRSARTSARSAVILGLRPINSSGESMLVKLRSRLSDQKIGGDRPLSGSASTQLSKRRGVKHPSNDETARIGGVAQSVKRRGAPRVPLHCAYTGLASAFNRRSVDRLATVGVETFCSTVAR